MGLGSASELAPQNSNSLSQLRLSTHYETINSMNETIPLNPRQKNILNLLSQHGELTRQQISAKLSTTYPVSKATLARDLAILVKQNKITTLSSGPATTYRPKNSHPLLKNLQLDQYFSLEPDQRQIQYTSFNSEIFPNLSNLISDKEQARLESQYKSFSKTTSEMSPTILKRELERFVIELAWKSSKIEGNTYSLLETEKLIKENKESPGHTKQEATMILNHKLGFDAILQTKQTFKTLSLPKIFQLHNTLVKDLDIETGVRTHAVGITGTSYLPPDNQWQLKDHLGSIIKVVNHATNPLEKALIITSMLAYLQPFADGNKRTARMIANAVLLAHDHLPLSYRSVDESHYKQALVLFYETNDLSAFKKLFFDQYLFALKTYFL